MNKKILLITLFFLTIGFAAVNTNLFLNVKSTFAYNEEDFKVYFSGGYINNLDHTNELVSGDNNKVIYTATELKEAGTNIKLSYDITNESSQFDALVVVNCTSSIDKVKITNNEENILVNAREINNGSTILSLSETITEDAVITCTMDITPLERTEENTGELTEVDTYVIYGNLVDTSNKAIANANLVIYSEEPHYVTTDEDGYLFYNGLERGSHEIYYVNDTMENIKGMTKEEVKAKAITSGEFTTTTTEEIVLKNNNKITNQGIMKTKPFCVSLEGNIWEYDYTGSEQQFISYCDGTYKIELWGAQGGDISNTYGGGIKYSTGGYGGYTAGDIIIKKNDNLYIYVGRKGLVNELVGHFNGGGGGAAADSGCASGGSATDIRLVKGVWNDFNSLKSRIMVVGAGAGAERTYLAGVAGGLQSTSSNVASDIATQTSGYAFGVASDAYRGITASGGGGGYYGGNTGAKKAATITNMSSAGGSSFISGHNGCNAIAENSTSTNIIHTGQANHYSGYKFTNTVMIDGAGYSWTNVKGSTIVGMPTHDGTGTMTGNSGNGYAKITFVSFDDSK